MAARSPAAAASANSAAGTLTLTGANSYTGGDDDHWQGTLRLGTGGSLAPTGVVIVDNGTPSIINGHDQTIDGLDG